MEYEWVAICEGEDKRKRVRLVVGSVWLHPHAGNAGCRLDDGDDMAGVRD